MKKTLLFAAVLLALGSVNAQTFITDDWTGGSLTSNNPWTSVTSDVSYDWEGSDLGSPGNPYARMDNYDGANNAVTAWMITPLLDLSTSTTPVLSFKNAYNFAGDALEMYVSTDYVGGDPGSMGTWIDITSSINWSTGGFAWVGSGDVDLTTYISATTYLAFKYTGTGTDGSTWEIDNFLVKEGLTVTPTLIIKDIQYTLGAPADSPEEGNEVTTSGVVTAISGEDSGDGYFIQDADGSWNGIVINDATNTPSVGDSVEVTGVVEENFDFTRIGSLTNFFNHGAATWQPTAEVITSNDAAALEEFESVLVTIELTECTSEDVGFGLWETNDGSGIVKVDDDCDVNFGDLGDWYDLTGIITYSFAEFKINPRTGADIDAVQFATIVDNDSKFDIYPNPASDFITLNIDADALVSIYSMTGAVVAEGVSTKTIDVSAFDAGIYSVVVTLNGTQSAQKLIIK
jgi:hypothetical protein